LQKKSEKANPSISAQKWTPDNGDGTYKNPVIFADYSDADVIGVGDDYYMTASSFSSIPGLPILHSKDLVNWSLIGHALDRYPCESFDKPQHGNGVWAPAIRYQNNMFYIYWGDPDRGIFMVRSKSITGPWQEPVLVLEGKGLIDSCPFWDDDGQAYLIHGWAASRSGINSLLTLYKMDCEGTKVVSRGKHVFDGHDDHPTIEGPKFYKRNGYYYILAPAGGVETGWQTALRSKNIYGPYEDKIVLEQGDTEINGPHQGGLVETPSGQSWFIHFQDREVYGRIIHLQPVEWVDDWPLMGRLNQVSGKCEPVTEFQKPVVNASSEIVNPATSDEFERDDLGLQWQWQGNEKLSWYSLIHGRGILRLFPHAPDEGGINLWDASNLLLQKFPAPDFTATAKITLTGMGNGNRGGLIIAGTDYSCLSMTEVDGGVKLAQVVCKDADRGTTEKVTEEVVLSCKTVCLRVEVVGPDAKCQFSYSLDDKNYCQVGKLFTAKAGRWIGAKVGLFCERTFEGGRGGYADVDWFRIS